MDVVSSDPTNVISSKWTAFILCLLCRLFFLVPQIGFIFENFQLQADFANIHTGMKVQRIILTLLNSFVHFIFDEFNDLFGSLNVLCSFSKICSILSFLQVRNCFSYFFFVEKVMVPLCSSTIGFCVTCLLMVRFLRQLMHLVNQMSLICTSVARIIADLTSVIVDLRQSNIELGRILLRFMARDVAAEMEEVQMRSASRAQGDS